MNSYILIFTGNFYFPGRLNKNRDSGTGSDFAEESIPDAQEP